MLPEWWWVIFEWCSLEQSSYGFRTFKFWVAERDATSKWFYGKEEDHCLKISSKIKFACKAKESKIHIPVAQKSFFNERIYTEIASMSSS